MHRWLARFFLLLTFVSAFALLGEARQANAATTRVWVGTSNLNWSTPGNWNPSGPPVNGDSLIFNIATNIHLNNDLVELTVASVTFNHGGTVTGNRLGISSSLATAANLTLDLPLVLKDDVGMSGASGTTVYFRNRLTALGIVAVDVNGHKLTLIGGGEFEVNGDLIGGGSIVATSKYFSYLVPVTYAGTVSGGPPNEILLTVIGDGSGYCGSAPNTKFVLQGGTLTAACAVSVAGISGTGFVNLFDDGHLTITGQPGATFNGQFTGVPPAFVRCCGTGSETLKGGNGFQSSIFLESGRLAFDGADFPFANFDVTGGTFAGYGTFGTAIFSTSTTSFEPVNGHVGRALFGTLQFSPVTHVRFTIRGPKPFLDYTAVSIVTQIVLDDAMLELDFGDYSPPSGQAITLIRDARTLLDTFKGLPEGANFNVGSLKFKITYTGGAGHDVIITSLGSNATPTATPTPVPGARPFKRYIPMVASAP